MKTILKIVFFLMLSSCIPESENCHKDLFFQNNSEEAIFLIWTEKRTAGDECDGLARGEVKSLEKSRILGVGNNCLETRIRNIYNGAVVLYIFEENPNIPYMECDSVLGHPDIVQTMEFTVDDLNRLDWTITYP